MLDANACLVMANYLIAISGHEGTNWQVKGTALACYTLATLGKLSALIYQLQTLTRQSSCSTPSTHIGFRMPLGSSRSAL